MSDPHDSPQIVSSDSVEEPGSGSYVPQVLEGERCIHVNFTLHLVVVRAQTFSIDVLGLRSSPVVVVPTHHGGTLLSSVLVVAETQDWCRVRLECLVVRPTYDWYLTDDEDVTGPECGSGDRPLSLSVTVGLPVDLNLN